MKIRVITPPEEIRGEADKLNALFAEGLHCLHLRKPEWTQFTVEALLNKIMPAYWSRIMLHSHFELADKYPVRGFHLPEPYRITLPRQELQEWLKQWLQPGKTVSTSVHQPQNLPDLPPGFSEVLVSPVFESISKAGYGPAESWNVREIRHRVPFHLIGLGGMEITRLTDAAQLGFTEIAVLGTLWKEPDQAVARFRQLQETAKALQSGI